jgi:hypothetical protein
MVGSIIPMVHGNRNGSTIMPLVFYSSGTIITAALSGAVYGAIGKYAAVGIFGRAGLVRVLLLTMACGHIAMAFQELGVMQFHLPQRRWQVPRHWQHEFPNVVTAFAYGGILGCGVFTRIGGAGFYLLPIWSMLLRNPTTGMVLFGIYGLGRALPVIAAAMAIWSRQTNNPYRVIDQVQPVAQVLSATLILAAGGWTLGTALIVT